MKAYSRLTRKLVLAYESGEGTLDEVADTLAWAVAPLPE
jgi:hypothetical protein